MKSPTTRRDAQREETRDRIYNAALFIFRRDGVPEARIEDIAEAAGVSRGTFYFHFPTKDDVLTARHIASEVRIADDLRKLSARASLPTVLRTFCTGFAEEWRGDPKIFPEVGVVALRASARSLAGPITSPVRLALAERFRQALDRKEMAGMLPAELLSDIFLTNAFAAALAWCANPALTLETVLAGVVTLFYDGVGRKRP
jgi:AcrR family transcriptional regulator